jgi:hypothetical protein
MLVHAIIRIMKSLKKKFEVSDFDKLGKTIFLSKSEAEAKLREMIK